MITTFLLLRPLSTPRPQVTNTELPAGSAFNVALRAMASRDGFETQWFGWQHAPRAMIESNRPPERFVWVINWQDTSTAQASMSAGELRTTLGNLVHFFNVPDAVPIDHDIDVDKAISKALTVQWSSDEALKLLNWTNRILLLGVYRPSSDSRKKDQQHIDDALSSEWTACGRVIPPSIGNDDWKPAVVTMRSISAQHSEDVEVYQDWQPFSALLPTAKTPQDAASSIAVSLTRTRWCTKIKDGLMETIKARRVE